MSWLKSLFAKQKSQQKPWSVRQVRISRITCSACNKAFKDGEMAWVNPMGYLVQHTNCEYTMSVPDEYCDEHGLLKE